MSSPSRYIIACAELPASASVSSLCNMRPTATDRPAHPAHPAHPAILPVFFGLAPGPHPRRELTLMRRRRLCLAATAAWPQAPLPDRRDPPDLSQTSSPTAFISASALLCSTTPGRMR